MAKETKLTDGMRVALEALKNYDGEPTLAELNETLDVAVSSGHLTGLVRKGLIESYDVERDQVGTVKVKLYTITDVEPTDEMKLTDGMINAYNVLVTAKEGTMAQLQAVESEMNIAVAHLTGLVRHGLATKEDVELERVTTRKVKAYAVTEAGQNYTEE